MISKSLQLQQLQANVTLSDTSCSEGDTPHLPPTPSWQYRNQDGSDTCRTHISRPERTKTALHPSTKSTGETALSRVSGYSGETFGFGCTEDLGMTLSFRWPSPSLYYEQ